jgi:hypothetical protein
VKKKGDKKHRLGEIECELWAIKKVLEQHKIYINDLNRKLFEAGKLLANIKR